MGQFIVDFVCIQKNLVVELDGGQHQDAVEYDLRRDRILKAMGFRVSRFWNNQVFADTTAVLEAILRAIGETPPP